VLAELYDPDQLDHALPLVASESIANTESSAPPSPVTPRTLEEKERQELREKVESLTQMNLVKDARIEALERERLAMEHKYNMLLESHLRAKGGSSPASGEEGALMSPASTHWRELAKAEAVRREKAEGGLESMRKRYKAEVDRRLIIESAIESKGFHESSPTRGLGLLASQEEPTPRSSKWGPMSGMNLMSEAAEASPLLPGDDAKAMYHAFLVVGSEGPASGGESGIIFKYPPDAVVPPQVDLFCLPGGGMTRGLKRTPSNSDLNKLLYGQGQGSSSNSFVFVLTEGVEGHKGMLYGVCVINEELLHQKPSFAQSPDEKEVRTL